jgi:hypothetical protein
MLETCKAVRIAARQVSLMSIVLLPVGAGPGAGHALTRLSPLG